MEAKETIELRGRCSVSLCITSLLIQMQVILYMMCASVNRGQMCLYVIKATKKSLPIGVSSFLLSMTCFLSCSLMGGTMCSVVMPIPQNEETVNSSLGRIATRVIPVKLMTMRSKIRERKRGKPGLKEVVCLLTIELM